ncbi:NERD domain-containing protein [Sphaerochaeta sp. PS]|uniref:NERD domain-containing protein n=1 Tax=Sphaerochaeta sp. PS TaxID=3076336 RepID=UPI0028A51613|nr:NERD domain-containing protein [Sphaerochaeta sp. PS]MDT4761144.1 NERD domain-containing protein [Sphaerochaeta sp. PS]
MEFFVTAVVAVILIGAIVKALAVSSHAFPIFGSKGERGEASVARRLEEMQNQGFRVFNDVLLRTERGTRQIDHVVVSTHGIFVIETKDYSGWIFGSENSEYWMQTFYKRKNQFRNPIKQNWAHVYALKEILSDYKQIAYFPIVVFTGSAVLQNIQSTVPVIYSRHLMDTIQVEERPNLSLEQVGHISARLEEAAIQGRGEKIAHVDMLRTQIHERKLKEQSLICPRCNGDLIVRHGRYGEFYGCSNYPKCRYTLSFRRRRILSLM